MRGTIKDEDDDGSWLVVMMLTVLGGPGGADCKAKAERVVC